MPPDRLPQELLYAIFEELRHDVTALKSCALVSQHFVVTARAHLFAEVYLPPPERPNAIGLCQRFCSILRRSPHLGLYVQRLEILQGTEPQSQWVAEEDTLPLILNALPNLRGISFDGGHGDLRWSLLPCDLKQAILNTFRLPGLTSITLRHFRGFSDIEEFLSLFVGCEDLKHLSLIRPDFTPPMPAIPMSPFNGRAQLNSLTVSDPSTLSILLLNSLAGSLSTVDVTRLRRLSVYTSAWTPLSNLLGAVGSSLEHLTIRIPKFRMYLMSSQNHRYFIHFILAPLTSDSIQIHGDTALRLLHLSFEGAPQLPWFVRFLREQRLHNLQDITLDILFSFDINAGVQADWDVVDVLLSDPTMSSLQRLSIRTYLPGTPYEPSRYFSSTTVKAWLPRMGALGLLQITEHVGESLRSNISEQSE